MGKKGKWFSAIKKAFSSNPKDNPTIVQVEKKDTRERHVEKKDTREKKKWAFGNPKKAELNSFIPIYREPSSIEKILGDSEREIDHNPYIVQPYQLPQNRRRSVEQERDRYGNKTYQSDSNRRSVEHERDFFNNNNGRNQNYNRVQQIAVNRFDGIRTQHEEVPNRLPQLQSNRINEDKEREMQQKGFHGVQLQRKARDETNLGQRTLKSQLGSKWVHPPRPKISKSVANHSAIKIQTAFRGYLARRNYRALKGLIRLQKMMRGQNVKYQTTNAMKSMQILVKVQSQIRTRRLEMMENRDYNALKVNNKDTDNIFGLWNTQKNRRGDGSWNDSVLTKEEVQQRMRKKVEAVMKRERALAYAYSHQLLKATPATTASAILADLHSGSNQWCWTPESNLKPKLKLPIQAQVEPISSKPKLKPNPKPKSNVAIKDDDSLTSCPPFSVPNYMAQTISAKAKMRMRIEEKQSKQNEKKRFNLGQSIFGKGYFWKDNNLGNYDKESVGRKHRSSLSMGSGFSIDSAVSMPVVVGRRPFK